MPGCATNVDNSRTDRIYDGVEAETRTSQASFRII